MHRYPVADRHEPATTVRQLANANVIMYPRSNAGRLRALRPAGAGYAHHTLPSGEAVRSNS
jgi:hypothetical protein